MNTFIYDEETALANKEIFLNDAMQCRELMMEEWEQRPWHKRLMEYIMRLFAPLL